MNRLYAADYSLNEFIEMKACAEVFCLQQGEAHEKLGWPQLNEYKCPELQKAYMEGRAKQKALMQLTEAA